MAGGEEARGTRCDDPFNQPDKEVPFVFIIVDMEADMLETTLNRVSPENQRNISEQLCAGELRERRSLFWPGRQMGTKVLHDGQAVEQVGQIF